MLNERFARIAVILCTLMLSIGVCCVAEDTACEHSWTLYTGYADDFLTQEAVIEPYDSETHTIIRAFPIEECSNCGEVRGQGYGAGYMQVHSYSVAGWQFVNEGMDVEIRFNCHICEYELTETVALQSILEGTETTCILGGECAANLAGSMYPEGIEQTNGFRTDAISFAGVVQVPCTEERSHYYLAERSYCPVCGRPQMQIFSISDALTAEWEKWPLYEADEFLSAEMPEELPYQLVDDLRLQVITP